MESENKKKRFIRFIDETIEKSGDEVCKKICEISCEHPLTLKLKIRDVGLVRYITFFDNKYSVANSSGNKIDCLMVFEKAKIIHHILIGKILPYNLDLIGKSNIIFFNERGKNLTSIYIPAKNNYSKIIRGTRFTLKPDEVSREKTQ
jgi:hypothetical protein